MIHAILDFLRSLTNPDRLIHLLATLLSGWLGYAVCSSDLKLHPDVINRIISSFRG